MSTNSSLAKIACVVMVAGLMADVASRFLSYDLVSFRAWEALRRVRGTGFSGQFEPNRRYENNRTYGDLSSIGNQPDLRLYHREVFTTDQYGNRNTPGISDGPPVTTLLVGTSFAAGAALSDDQTFGAQISRLIGGPVYNAVGATDSQIRDAAARLHMKRGILITEVAGRLLLSGAQGDGPASGWESWKGRLGPLYIPVRAKYQRLRAWFNDSPLELALYLVFKRFEDDRVLPNSHAKLVIRDELFNGDPVLFLRRPLERAATPAEVEASVSFWKGRSRQLASSDIELLLVIVPEKGIVYGPLSIGGGPKEQIDPGIYVVTRELEKAGIPVVDVTPALMAAARDGLPSKNYVFWRDDTHWSPAGAAIAAQVVADRLRAVQPATGHP